jgi:hypothetical protein
MFLNNAVLLLSLLFSDEKIAEHPLRSLIEANTRMIPFPGFRAGERHCPDFPRPWRQTRPASALGTLAPRSP